MQCQFPGRTCLPMHFHQSDDSQGVAAYETVLLQNNSDSTSLAETVLVSYSSKHVSGFSDRAATLEESAVTGKGEIFHQDPKSLNLTAWLLSTDISLQRDFQRRLESYWHYHGEKAQERITLHNLSSSACGVLNGRWIPFLPL